MDSQAQDRKFSWVGDLCGTDFGAQNEPTIVFVQACKSKLISKIILRPLCDSFSFDLDTIFHGFWAYFGRQSMQGTNQAHPKKSLKNHLFLHDFAKSILIFESHRWLIIDVLRSLRTFSYFKPSWDQILMSFWKPLGLHFDLQNQSGPWLE